jgi:hypothetical protein
VLLRKTQQQPVSDGWKGKGKTGLVWWAIEKRGSNLLMTLPDIAATVAAAVAIFLLLVLAIGAAMGDGEEK